LQRNPQTQLCIQKFVFYFENLAVYEKMWGKKKVRPGTPHTTKKNTAHEHYKLDPQGYKYTLAI
jgi:hypothetical protein